MSLVWDRIDRVRRGLPQVRVARARHVAGRRQPGRHRQIRAALHQLGHTPPAHPPATVERNLGRGSAGHGRLGVRMKFPSGLPLRGAFPAWTQSARMPFGSATDRSAPPAIPHCFVNRGGFWFPIGDYIILPGANQQRHNVRASRVGCFVRRNGRESFRICSGPQVGLRCVDNIRSNLSNKRITTIDTVSQQVSASSVAHLRLVNHLRDSIGSDGIGLNFMDGATARVLSGCHA